MKMVCSVSCALLIDIVHTLLSGSAFGVSDQVPTIGFAGLLVIYRAVELCGFSAWRQVFQTSGSLDSGCRKSPRAEKLIVPTSQSQLCRSPCITVPVGSYPTPFLGT